MSEAATMEPDSTTAGDSPASGAVDADRPDGVAAPPTSTNRRILKAAGVVAAMTVGVRVLGLLKEPIVAAFFGTRGEMDAFLVAFLLPTFFINITSSAFASTFIPAYLRVVGKDGDRAGADFLRGALFLSLSALSLGVVSLAVFAPLLLPLIGASLNDEQLELARGLLLILGPTLIVKGASTLWASILNSRERFAVAAFVPAAIPVCTLIALLGFARDQGIIALAWGTLAGYLAEALLLAGALRRRGIPVLPRWRAIDEHMRGALSQYTPILAGAAVVSGAILVDQAMAASLGEGSVSSLHYGQKLTAIGATIAATALGTAILPYFSRLEAEENRAEIRRVVLHWIRVTLAVAVPVTALLFLFAEDIVRLLYERGEFLPQDTMVVSGVMGMYVLYVPSFLVGTVLARYLSSARRNGVLMQAALISLPLNVGLNWLFMRSLGVEGIALSTSIVYLVTMLYSGAATWRALNAPTPPPAAA